ncbi:MAG: hypothetical protein ABSG36_18305 [Acidimicrobiales bacterium]
MTGSDTGPDGASRRGFDRRRFLVYGLGGIAAVAVVGFTGVELSSYRTESSPDNRSSTSSRGSAR